MSASQRKCSVVWPAGLWLIGLWLTSACGMSVVYAAATRPNILFIYTDDHTHRSISCYPEAWDWVETPHIDALAARGVRFAHAFIGTWCMPSRATMLTGHHQFGVESMRMWGDYPGSTYDPGLCPFWPKVFRAQGYITAQIGKWHTGTDTGAGRDWDWQAVWNRPRYTQNSTAYYYDEIIEFSGRDQPTESKQLPGYSTDNYTNLAEDFIRGEHREEGRPWYLWLCYGAVHGPYTPAIRHRDAYPNAQIPVPADIFPPRAGKPDYMQRINSWQPGPDGQPVLAGRDATRRRKVPGSDHTYGNTLNEFVRQYHQSVLAIDEGVGRLTAALQETNQLNNTLVVFTSDQGFAWGQHGFQMKLAPYDATIRSPLIVSMPGTIPEGNVVEHPVAGVDLIPTFFSFADIKLPWKMHGHDLTPILKDPSADWPHPAMVAFTGRLYGSDTHRIPEDRALHYQNGVPWYVSIRQGKFKYIRTLVDNEIEELYHLEDDPDELTNLALTSQYREQLRAMRNTTMDEMRRTEWPLVEFLPPIREEIR